MADGTVVKDEAVALSHTHSIQTAAMPGWLPPYHVSATVGYTMQLAPFPFVRSLTLSLPRLPRRHSENKQRKCQTGTH